jgi:hypothetical protein
MTYDVDWTDDGIDALTLVWLQAADRNAVAAGEGDRDCRFGELSFLK